MDRRRFAAEVGNAIGKDFRGPIIHGGGLFLTLENRALNYVGSARKDTPTFLPFATPQIVRDRLNEHFIHKFGGEQVTIEAGELGRVILTDSITHFPGQVFINNLPSHEHDFPYAANCNMAWPNRPRPGEELF